MLLPLSMRSMIQQQTHSVSHALTQGNNNSNNISNNIISEYIDKHINYCISRSNSNIIGSENKNCPTSSSPVRQLGHPGYWINSPPSVATIESIALARIKSSEHKALQLHHQIPLPDHLLLMESSLHHSQHGSSNACYNGKSGSHSMVIKTQIGARKVTTSPSAHPHPHPVTASSGSTLVSNVRVIRLKRPSNSPLGFSVKGGMEILQFPFLFSRSFPGHWTRFLMTFSCSNLARAGDIHTNRQSL